MHEALDYPYLHPNNFIIMATVSVQTKQQSPPPPKDQLSLSELNFLIFQCNAIEIRRWGWGKIDRTRRVGRYQWKKRSGPKNHERNQVYLQVKLKLKIQA